VEKRMAMVIGIDTRASLRSSLTMKYENNIAYAACRLGNAANLSASKADTT
jgi:hypothetical protein